MLKNKYVKSNHMLITRLNKDNNLYEKNDTKSHKLLSDVQLKYILNTSYELADINPTLHERTYFLISLMYYTGVKITELSGNSTKYPKMNDFYQAKKAWLEVAKDNLVANVEKSQLSNQYQELKANWFEQQKSWRSLVYQYA